MISEEAIDFDVVDIEGIESKPINWIPYLFNNQENPILLSDTFILQRTHDDNVYDEIFFNDVSSDLNKSILEKELILLEGIKDWFYDERVCTVPKVLYEIVSSNRLLNGKAGYMRMMDKYHFQNPGLARHLKSKVIKTIGEIEAEARKSVINPSDYQEYYRLKRRTNIVNRLASIDADHQLVAQAIYQSHIEKNPVIIITPDSDIFKILKRAIKHCQKKQEYIIDSMVSNPIKIYQVTQSNHLKGLINTHYIY